MLVEKPGRMEVAVAAFLGAQVVAEAEKNVGARACTARVAQSIQLQVAFKESMLVWWSRSYFFRGQPDAVHLQHFLMHHEAFYESSLKSIHTEIPVTASHLAEWDCSWTVPDLGFIQQSLVRCLLARF